MQSDLAKSVLNAIDPEMLKHFCLDMVKEPDDGGEDKDILLLKDGGQDGQSVAYGTISDLSIEMTGPCTALKT